MDLDCLLLFYGASFGDLNFGYWYDQEFFYTFFYLLFVSLTPAFYISPAGSNAKTRDHYIYMGLIYFFSFLFLVSNNLFFFYYFLRSHYFSNISNSYRVRPLLQKNAGFLFYFNLGAFGLFFFIFRSLFF